MKRKARESSFRLIEIPVCYDEEFGFDLEEVAQRAKLSVGETIQMHAAGKYRVHCVGFTPGFAFLGGLDAKTSDAATHFTAHKSSGWIGCDRRKANGCLSDSIARRLECHWSHAAADV